MWVDRGKRWLSGVDVVVVVVSCFPILLVVVILTSHSCRIIRYRSGNPKGMLGKVLMI
jgi:hypothetical protein